VLGGDQGTLEAVRTKSKKKLAGIKTKSIIPKEVNDEDLVFMG
jgi:hypothetical protein